MSNQIQGSQMLVFLSKCKFCKCNKLCLTEVFFTQFGNFRVTCYSIAVLSEMFPITLTICDENTMQILIALKTITRPLVPDHKWALVLVMPLLKLGFARFCIAKWAMKTNIAICFPCLVTGKYVKSNNISDNRAKKCSTPILSLILEIPLIFLTGFAMCMHLQTIQVLLKFFGSY